MSMTEEAIVHKHILIPTDGSSLARQGVARGLELAKTHGAKVTAMTATEAPGGQFAFAADLWTLDDDELAAYEQSQADIAEGILGEVKTMASGLGLQVETVHIPNCRASVAIVDAARACGCDVIVMASHGRSGMSRVLLGNQAAEVVAAAPMPVVIIR